MKICLILGTRPEIIKLSPVIKELRLKCIEFFIIHSNQHYSENMDSIFFKDLDLPAPKYNLNIGSGGHSLQTGSILIKIEPILEKELPDWVIVQGDTNTVLAGALAAHKMGIKVAHLEAGLRSYDKSMPEESNRILTDHLSDLLFAVTETQAKILLSENIEKSKIQIIGNTIVDAVRENIILANEQSKILKKLQLKEKSYCLFTCHRSGNVDKEEDLQEIVELLRNIPDQVCWPIHVRTKKKLNEFSIILPENIIVTEPLGFLDFLQLENNAKYIITDSGGVQEEACILGVPCITIRDNTERPETVHVGANVLISRNKELLLASLSNLPQNWENPFGNGDSAKKVIQHILSNHLSTIKKEKICIVGLGYMGLPTGLLFANNGHEVVGFDINSKKVDMLNSGICPFNETGINNLLTQAIKSGRFSASNELPTADVYIIAVPTPHINSKCDLSFVLKAAQSVAKVSKDNDLVIIESTIKPRTCIDSIMPIFEMANKKINLAHCPERAIPGETLKELIYNDRVIGGTTEEAKIRAKNLYSSFVKGNIFLTDLITAEAIKLMENTYRDVNIALANEFSIIADELNFNIWEAIKLANNHPRVNILEPGPGVGGHCIAIDPWFLIEEVKNSRLIRSAREVNDIMPKRIIERFFKKNTFCPK
jgi:UDP-N-acetylglucosamine 2-epimerase (non-hydrolysing)